MSIHFFEDCSCSLPRCPLVFSPTRAYPIFFITFPLSSSLPLFSLVEGLFSQPPPAPTPALARFRPPFCPHSRRDRRGHHLRRRPAALGRGANGRETERGAFAFFDVDICFFFGSVRRIFSLSTSLFLRASFLPQIWLNCRPKRVQTRPRSRRMDRAPGGGAGRGSGDVGGRWGFGKLLLFNSSDGA